METAFLSYHFADRGTPLYSRLVRVLESQGLRLVTGRNLGGGPLNDVIKARISESDCLLALMTKVAGPPAESVEKQKWVRDEYLYAHQNEIPAIALREAGVELGGMIADNEYIPLDRDDQLETMVRLVETIGEWRDRVGSRIQVRLAPEDVARDAVRQELTRCRYREFAAGRHGNWRNAQLVREPGGVFAHLARVRPRSSIEIEVKMPQGRWISPATPQYAFAQLEKERDR